METMMQVKGMTCDHCKKAVEGALTGLSGVKQADVNLESGKVLVTHNEAVSNEALKEAVEDQGYDVV
ncbi:copper ion binding protein [Halobacillus litoralis]|uniref:copper ion binding protein n=1 Tax=Halobacillus litoralis TaxID=45668 RepID=UPI001CD443DA|nr:copper ion binding protein [Halobacillus litoralis]MCA1023455.1 copper ion binding protein [Halobacillus litoralis]